MERFASFDVVQMPVQKVTLHAHRCDGVALPLSSDVRTSSGSIFKRFPLGIEM